MLLLSRIGPDTAFVINKRPVFSVSMNGEHLHPQNLLKIKNKNKSNILPKKEGKPVTGQTYANDRI